MQIKKFWIKFLSAFIPSSSRRKKFRRRHITTTWYDFATDYGFKTDNPSPLIIDCGANVGASVRFFHKCYPGARIEAYEADPSIFENELLPNLSSEGTLPSGIRCHNKAVWTDNNGVEFYPDGALSGSCVEAPLASEQEDKLLVPSVRLKEIINQCDQVDFLKIDIEGAELAVLKDCAMVLHKVHRIFVEYHSFVGRPQELSELLSIFEAYGFRYRIAEDYNPSRQYWDYRDNDNNMDCQLKIYALNLQSIHAGHTRECFETVSPSKNFVRSARSLTSAGVTSQFLHCSIFLP